MSLRAGHLYLLVGGLIWSAVSAALIFPLGLVVAVVTVASLVLFRAGRDELGPAAIAGAVGLVVIAGGRGWMERVDEDRVMAAPVEAGPTTEVVEMIMSPRRSEYGYWALASSADGRYLLRYRTAGPDGVGHRLLAASPGDRVVVEGDLQEERGDAMGRAFGGVITVDTATIVSRSRLHALADAMRQRVLEVIQPERSPSRALLAGFLIGATDNLPDEKVASLRRSGLSHFVAVSGSNVALFLAFVFLISGPMGWSPRPRALLGLLAIVVFVVMTRFEPSVVRAGTMAGLVLGGRLVGFPLDGFAALGIAIGASVIVAPSLANDVGFALSALATFGVLVATRIIHSHDWGVVRRGLVVTLGAQLAVAPLLVLVFGSVPVAAPVANLIAAPLVTAATVTATIGVMTGISVVVSAAAFIADLVLGVSGIASGMGQAGPVAIVVVLLLLITWWRFPRLRLSVGAVLGAMVVLSLLPSIPVRGPVMITLDVGQGDAILVVGEEGETMLVDGGPDGEVLLDGLSRYGIDEIDLVVASHVHADHVTGLAAVFERLSVGAVWLPTPPHTTPTYQRLLETIDETKTTVSHPAADATYRLGTLEIEVVAPLRRYASPNDQSTVLAVTTGSHDILLSGDIEKIAQDELSGLHAHVLKVPHQGAATSDLEWLDSVNSEIAVISVGANDFGHPSDEVIATLEAGGATVRRTDLEGDIVIPLG